MLKEAAKSILATFLSTSVYVRLNAVASTRKIVSRKLWEPEIDRISPFIHQGDTVIDVGANHGLYAFHLSRMVGLSGKVHCFEPIPPNYRVLRHTVESLHLDNVITFNAACGAKTDQLTFGVPSSMASRNGNSLMAEVAR